MSNQPVLQQPTQIVAKIRRTAVAVIIVIAVIAMAYWNSILYSRKTHQENNRVYSQAMIGFVVQLQQKGLVQAGHIGPGTGSNAVIVILVPSTNEVMDEEILQLVQLITFTARVFESSKSLTSGDIQLTFLRPTKQQIIFVARPQGLPGPLDLIGEFTVSSNKQPGQPISVVNLSGTPKALGSTFTTAWNTIQAVCLGYTIQQNSNADSECNVVAANAAAGWAGIDRKTAESQLNVLGSTNVSYLGSQDINFRFIDFVYQKFIQ
jgi:hypothetical protein